jgi:hypothetical protein
MSAEQLSSMQSAFETRLRRTRWNNFERYKKTELDPHMTENVLLLDQGFIDLALYPIVKKILNRYLGDKSELTEAKSWKSIPTKRDLHGWHGDSYYDQKSITEIASRSEAGFYLFAARRGALNYMRGSHRRQHPRPVRNNETGVRLQSVWL